MIRKSTCILLALAFELTAFRAFALDIQNFRSGLVCDVELEYSDDVDLPIGWICFETETVYITGQGRCVYNREDRQCTWYGYEFNYTGAVEGDEIFCRSTSVLAGNLGSPTGIDEQDTTVSEWSYSLPFGDGHHYNPQYSVLGMQAEAERVDSTETVCTYNGKELFRFRFTKIYPALNEKVIKDSIRRILSE